MLSNMFNTSMCAHQFLGPLINSIATLFIGTRDFHPQQKYAQAMCMIRLESIYKLTRKRRWPVAKTAFE